MPVLLLCCVSSTKVSNHLLLFLTTVFLPKVQNFATTGSSTTFRSENRDQDSYSTTKYVDPLIIFVISAVSGNSYRSTYNHNNVFHQKLSSYFYVCHHGIARHQAENGGDGTQIWIVRANTLNQQ